MIVILLILNVSYFIYIYIHTHTHIYTHTHSAGENYLPPFGMNERTESALLISPNVFWRKTFIS